MNPITWRADAGIVWQTAVPTVVDDKIPDKTYTEEGMNLGIRENELPDKFATGEYQVLLVAEKYQTGFDQPLLHTMYVDKRLAGIQAVQTLSRLNRTHPLKEDTFILDFVNERDEIQEAFKQFYEGAVMGEEVDPARLYEIKAELDRSGVYLPEEVERFCEVFFQAKARQSFGDHKAMNAALDPAVDRFRGLQQATDDEAELWRRRLWAFRNLYAFLSQIIPYQDGDLERLYTYLRHLAPKLPRRGSGSAYQFDDEVRLEYYRLQKISEGSISLKEGMARRRLKRGVFRSVAELQAAINRFVDETNNDPKPFVWTADPNRIIAAVKRGHQASDSIH